jgi:hypothetical protein
MSVESATDRRLGPDREEVLAKLKTQGITTYADMSYDFQNDYWTLSMFNYKLCLFAPGQIRDSSSDERPVLNLGEVKRFTERVQKTGGLKYTFIMVRQVCIIYSAQNHFSVYGNPIWISYFINHYMCA